MSYDNTADWMDEVDSQAQDHSGTPPNAEAPILVREKAKSPRRATKGIYIQEKHSIALDRLAFSQKMKKGKSAPQLAEEAIELLMKKYNME